MAVNGTASLVTGGLWRYSQHFAALAEVVSANRSMRYCLMIVYSSITSVSIESDGMNQFCVLIKSSIHMCAMERAMEARLFGPRLI